MRLTMIAEIVFCLFFTKHEKRGCVGKCISCFAFFVLNGGMPRLKTMGMNGAVFQVVRARNVCFVCAEG